MPDDYGSTKWFYRETQMDDVKGPVGIVELAALLRVGEITEDTLSRAEGEDTWMRFKYSREFEWARDMPVEVIHRHLNQKAETEKEASPFTWRKSYFFLTFLGGFSVYLVIFLGKILLNPNVSRSHTDGNEWLGRLLLLLFRH